MKQLKNIDYKQILELQDSEKNIQVLKVIDKLIETIKEPEELNKLIKDKNIEEPHLSIYSSICIFLAETKDLITTEIDVEGLCHQYMIMLKTLVESQLQYLPNSLFGGLSDIGFGVHSLYKVTSHYKKFIDSLNKFIINSSKENIKIYKENINDVKIRSFDTMAGLTGVIAYLLLYKDEKDVRNLIEEGLSYLVLLTQDREVDGHVVPSYYISSENQFLDSEKEFYKKGNFNLGLSHGITGPLAVLSIALMEEIEIEGQRQAITRILEDLKTFNYIDDKEVVYWPGRIKFEDYISKQCKIDASRASWCYGTPGIARAIYIAGKAINDKEAIELSIKAIDGLCNMDEKDWMLNSPTMCHGYAGLLAVIETMYQDTGDAKYKECIERLIDIIFNFYEEDSIFGFKNIDPKEVSKGQYKMVEQDKITLLQGSIGVMLNLLATIKTITTDWKKNFLI